MDLFITAVVLSHPDQPEPRLEVDHEFGERITDAESVILRRLQVDGWQAFSVRTKKVETLLTGSQASDFMDVAYITFTKLCPRLGIEPAFITETGNKLYRKSDLEPHMAQEV